MRALIAAIRFLTRLRVPGPATRAEDLPRSVVWFPLVGCGVGAAIGGIHLLALHWWPPALAALLAIAFGLLLTGALHEDAVGDTADGLGGGGGDRDRVLAILKDPRIGSYGTVALWLLLALRWSALIALGAAALPAFALASVWGRWTAAPLIRWLPALGGGLGRDIQGGLGTGMVLLTTAAAVAASAGLALAGASRVGPAIAVAVVLTLGWGWHLRRRPGGQTGDLLGAGNQLVEAGVLLTLLAR